MKGDRKLAEQLARMMNKARRALDSAAREIADDNFDFSCSRSYYAAFYCMEGLLLTKGLTYSKHSAVLSGFSEQFLKTNVFDRQLSKRITRLFRDRQLGDYGFDVPLDCAQAQQCLEDAKDIYSKTEEYLSKAKLLDAGKPGSS
ncbi:MAG: HEPN domain-containing protein [Chitinivibrionales bacterium]|nr:HEPN domain-containing protein [Chitinivibrionales bacterium]MBD3394662.1 HEPN domain-containing protein [Chitinivibrionales bacterium]